MLRLLIGSVLVLLALGASADETRIRRMIEPKLGGVRVDAIQPSQIPGLWEVRFRSSEGLQILYTDAAGEFIVSGNIYDAKTDRNLTEERIRRLSAIRFDSLPLEQAVKIQRGNGRRVMAMFSDPH